MKLLTLLHQMIFLYCTCASTELIQQFGCNNYAACHEGSLRKENDQWICDRCFCIPGTTEPNCDFQNFCESASCKWRNTQKCRNTFDNFECVCEKGWGGPNCGKNVTRCLNNPCTDPKECDVVDDKRECSCPKDYEGRQNCKPLPCAEKPCKNGGTCNNIGSSYTCQCHIPWIGEDCSVFDACYGVECVNGGTCKLNQEDPGFSSTRTCLCLPGYTGKNCEQEIDFCESSPCQFNSKCYPKFNDYECRCLFGTFGKNCETNPDDCLSTWSYEGDSYELKDEKPVECNSKDEAAECHDLRGRFICQCSPAFTGKFCDMNLFLWRLLMALYGEINDDIMKLLESLLGNTAEITSVVPLLIALAPTENQTALSWTHDEMFEWMTFEEHDIDFREDTLMWTDAVLGNCFTFNHRNLIFKYQQRATGDPGGLYAKALVNQSEYLPWTDTASILVFVHNKDDNIFSESVRYACEPGGETVLDVSKTHYHKLGGKFGKCARDKSEVPHYYYPGSYSQGACFRSCYQEVIFEKCKCMDPRYPMSGNASACQITQRKCLNSAEEEAGDPYSWSWCDCPPACEVHNFFVSVNRAEYREFEPVCTNETHNWRKCIRQQQDNVRILVRMTALETKTYAEVPEMTFSKFMASFGGLIGVLMGLSVTSFIEFFYLLLKMLGIIVFNRGAT